METELQNPFIATIIGLLVIHTFLIFCESVKSKHGQFHDFKKIRLKNLEKELLLKELLKITQYEDDDDEYTIKSIVKAFWGLNILRVVGFVPFTILFITACIFFSKSIFVEDLPFDKISQILIVFIGVLDGLLILFKAHLKIPDILMKLNPNYSVKSYIMVLFSIFPIWKKDA